MPDTILTNLGELSYDVDVKGYVYETDGGDLWVFNEDGDYMGTSDEILYGEMHDPATTEITCFEDLAYMLVRHTYEYQNAERSEDEPVIFALCADKIKEEENIHKFNWALYLDNDIWMGRKVLKLTAVQKDIGPVWGTITTRVEYPCTYVAISDAVSQIQDEMYTLESLTQGCPMCWSNVTFNKISEIAEEYDVDDDFVEDIMEATYNKELSNKDLDGPVQPNCFRCGGSGRG